MNRSKTEILDNLCYTDLVYSRINKKLNCNLSNVEIEKMLSTMIAETREGYFQKKGKNYYITNVENAIRITVNSNTCRVITVDRAEL